MTMLFLVLFIVGTAVLLWKMFFESLGDQLPGACPRCGKTDEPLQGAGTIIGGYRRWYHQTPGQRIRCRVCMTKFKNHPNGTLVEDRS
jgi:hypothetical protein